MRACRVPFKALSREFPCSVARFTSSAMRSHISRRPTCGKVLLRTSAPSSTPPTGRRRDTLLDKTLKNTGTNEDTGVGLFPNEASLLRLVSAMFDGGKEEWESADKAYLKLESD